MALKFFDRVNEIWTGTGTGAMSLAGAYADYVTFGSVLSNADTCYITIVNPGVNEWECSLATYTTSGNTLTRTTVYASTNANAAVNFSAGTKTVFITPIAHMIPTGTALFVPQGAVTSSGLTQTTARLLGRTTSSTGAIEEISVSGLTLSGGVLTGAANYVWLATLTASNSATLSDTTHITSTYAAYLLIFENVILVDNNISLRMRVSIDAGANWISTDTYEYTGVRSNGSGGAASNTDTETSFPLDAAFTIQNDTDRGVCGQLIFQNPSSSEFKFISGVVALPYVPQPFGTMLAGRLSDTTSVINGIQFYPDTGNISTGNIYLVGLKLS